MAADLTGAARAVVKRTLNASPYRERTLVPTLVPFAPSLVAAFDRMARTVTRAQTVAQLERSCKRNYREAHAPCPLCGTDAARVRYHPRLGGDVVAYHVAQCDGCDLLYRVPAIRPERVPELYQGGDYSDFLDGDYGKDRQSLYRQVMDAYSPLLDDGSGRTVLDFGCGTGAFLEVAGSRGFDVYGVDLAPDSVERARARFGTDRVAEDPSHLELPASGGFDLITLWSVLAHLAIPREQLRELFDLLTPGGQLLIYTVNAEALRRRAFGSRWTGFTPNHLIFWARGTLERLLRQVGFASVEFRHMYEIPRPTSDVSQRLIERHHRVVERWDGAHMLSAIATK